MDQGPALSLKAHRGASRKMPLALWVSISGHAVEALCSGRGREGRGDSRWLSLLNGRWEMDMAASFFLFPLLLT